MKEQKIIRSHGRNQTMIKRLGKAAKLVDNEKYLPMFRNRQINFKEEFDFSVKLANKKRKPARYFAKIWSPANLEKTINWLREKIARAISDRADRREAERREKRAHDEAKAYNQAGINRLNQLKVSHGLIT